MKKKTFKMDCCIYRKIGIDDGQLKVIFRGEEKWQNLSLWSLVLKPPSKTKSLAPKM